MITNSDSDVFDDRPAADLSPKKELWNRPFIRVGHGGAAGNAPANTLKSLAKAIEIGVDMVEFDVRPCLDDLVLLHDDSLLALSGDNRLASQSTLAELRTLDAGEGERIATLAEALDLVKGKVLMNVDLKTQGIEAGVVQTMQRMGVSSDVLISSLESESLRRLRELSTSLKTAISYPKDRGSVSGRPILKPVISVILQILRFTLRYQILGKIEAGQANGTMLHYSLISSETVRKVHAADRIVFAWTVDDLPTLRRVRAMGVDGIASNYPALFQELE